MRCDSGDIHRDTAETCVILHISPLEIPNIAGKRGIPHLFRRVSGKDIRKGVWFWPPNFGYFFSLTLSHFFWDNFVGQIVGQGCQEGSDFSRIKWVYNFCLVFILFYYFCPKIPLLSQKKSGTELLSLRHSCFPLLLDRIIVISLYKCPTFFLNFWKTFTFLRKVKSFTFWKNKKFVKIPDFCGTNSISCLKSNQGERWGRWLWLQLLLQRWVRRDG